jgi:hypothetical protein
MPCGAAHGTTPHQELPVIENDKMVGIITRANLLHAKRSSGPAAIGKAMTALRIAEAKKRP